MRYWVPVLLIMGVIFFLSSRPHFGITGTFFFDFAIFKILHMMGYAVFYFFIFRALYQTSPHPSRKLLAYAAVFAVLYAISDEIHQQFVPTREGRLRDVFIDLTGIVIVWAFIKTHFNFVTKHLM